MKKIPSVINTNSGKRDPLSLCLLNKFPVTISLENHGELTAHSRCSNDLLVAACGKNIAHKEKSHSEQISLAALTVLQGRENWAKEQEDLKSLNTLPSKEIQPESTMFYTSKTKKEELERYQDCSWFQNKPSKDDLISKLSQAENLVSPDIEVNELDLGMQFANRDIPQWGDEYLEVFDDEDLYCELEDKFGEKENHIYPSNENSAYINHKLGEDGISDLSIYNNYAIRKTDSYDNMKIITSTNLSDVIPMSYQEQVNNVNYNIQPFNKIKSEVKEEFELYSLESDSCAMESEDSDLNIGREEVIEVEVHDTEDTNEPGAKYVNGITEYKKPVEEIIPEIGDVKDHQEMQYAPFVADNIGVHDEVPAQKLKLESYDEHSSNIDSRKANIKLELTKNIFEQPLNVPTPELYFMDLVDYINNEMNPVSAEPSPQLYMEQPPMQNVSMPLKESSPNTVPTPLQLPPQEEGNMTQRESFPKSESMKTEKVEKKRGNLNDLGTINLGDMDSMSIAERIKTGTSRKRPSRYSLENIQPSEDEENKDGEDEYQFDYYHPRKRRCRSRSRNSESTSSKSSGDNCDMDSYRERRDKNNEASRRSRQNKKDKERQMYRSREEAERRNVVLKAKADKLEKLVTYLRQMLLQLVLKKGSGT